MPTWTAWLIGAGLGASLLCPEVNWCPQLLTEFIAELDAEWRGWQGEKTWGSGEDELRLSARHDKTGTVLLTARLQDGAPPRWSCQAGLELDPGGFRQLAADARRLSEVSLSM